MTMEIFVYVLIGIVLIESGALIVIIVMAMQKEKIDQLMTPCVDCAGQGIIRDAVNKIGDDTELHKIGLDNEGQVYRFISCESCKGSGYQFTGKGAEILERLKKRGFLNG